MEKTMQNVPFARNQLNPRFANNFLDTCAFDPKYTPEHEAAQEIRRLSNQEQISLVLAHSNQREIDHPNTPAEVKEAAAGMIFTIPTELNSDEKARKSKAHTILTGNGKPEKFAADAAHVFEAGKHGGYFITTDERILSKRDDLRKATHANILLPSEWLNLFQSTASTQM